jgi:sulfoxide reductase catalytic subunit YedY
MLIQSRKPADVRSSEITPKPVYLDRRRFLQAAALAGAGAAMGPLAGPARAGAGMKLPGVVKSAHSTAEAPTPFDKITAYNNFYEFGTDKGDPAKYAGGLKTKPWSVAVEGEIAKPAVYAVEDLIRPHKLEERIYRLRCVETWSMVVPWVGIPLGDVIRRLEPTSKARFVAFETLHDPEQMRGQRYAALRWPYDEGLRMDEALHPLAILAVGLYGEKMPNQNGAPIRLVVPWKYGFKCIKSIVRMRFQEAMPETAWSRQAPREYGFFANVNPTVDHPRWSQAKERRIGEFLKRKTLMFNGYADEVGHLYAGMDLQKYY